MTRPGRGIVGPLVAAGIAAAVYLPTAARYVLGGDNGEFATLYAEGGLAHPSGYPLYTLILRAFAWLPVATPAHGAAIVTALLGAVTAGALFVACRRWGASEAASALATLVYVTSPHAWELATEAEVFTLHAGLAAVILALAAPVHPLDARGARRRVVGLGLAAGMGLANHLTLVFMTPVGLTGAVCAARGSKRPVRTLALGALAVLPGLLTYLSLVITARHAGGRWLWADTRTLHGLVRHVVRADYGIGTLSSHGGAPQPVRQLAALATDLFVDLHGVILVAGVAVASVYLARWRREPLRAALAVTFLVAGPLFALRMNVSPVGVGTAIVGRFHLLPEVLLTVLAAVGLDTVFVRYKLGTRALAWTAVGAFVLGYATTLPTVLSLHGPTLENYVFDTLSTVEPRAVLMGTGDHRQLGILYAQHALGVRRDVLYIDPWLLLLPAHRARIEASLGRQLPALHGRTVDTRAIAETVLSTGRALYLTDVFTPAIVRALPTYPIGTLVRVLPRGARLPSPAVLMDANDALVRGDRLHPPVRTADPWAILALGDYARPWKTLADVWLRRGDITRSQDCARRAEGYTPARP